MIKVLKSVKIPSDELSRLKYLDYNRQCRYGIVSTAVKSGANISNEYFDIYHEAYIKSELEFDDYKRSLLLKYIKEYLGDPEVVVKVDYATESLSVYGEVNDSVDDSDYNYNELGLRYKLISVDYKEDSSEDRSTTTN